MAAAAAYWRVSKAVQKHVGSGASRQHFRDFVAAEFRARAGTEAAVQKHVGSGASRQHFRDFVAAEFRAPAKERLQLAGDYLTSSPASTSARSKLRDRVTDLGDHSLFLGRGESFALSAREYPAIKRNHVYGLALQARSGDGTLTEWAFVYDLSSDTLKEIHHPKELREDGTKIWRPLYWLCLRSSYKRNQQQ